MIYTLSDKLAGSRVMADKAYEVEDLVEKELRERGKEFSQPIIDVDENRRIAAPQIAAIYILIGFDPEIDPCVADQMPERVKEHDSAKSVRRDFQLEVILNLTTHLLPAGDSLPIRSSDYKFLVFPVPDEKISYIMKTYGIRDPELPFLRFNQSGKIVYDWDKNVFAGILAEIVLPEYWMNHDEQLRYLQELKDIKYKDHPSIINVATSANMLLNRLITEKS